MNSLFIKIVLVFLFIFLVPVHVGSEEAYPQTDLMIRKIRVKGHYPYLTKKILRLVSLQPGDPFQPEKLEESGQRLREFFEKQGYYGTQVSIEPKKDPLYPAMNLKISIDKGNTYRLEEIIFEGNTVFRDSVLRNKLKGFGHFSLTRTEKRLKKIQKKYNKKGFVRARVRLLEVLPHPDTHKVDLKVEIKEHKHLNLLFRGNRWFSPQTLDDSVTFFRERGYSRFEVERSLSKLTDFYHQNGFPDVSISSETVKGEDDEIQVTFFIDEGMRVRTKKIIFGGDKKVKPKKLKKQMSLEEHTLTRQGFYREANLEEDRERLLSYYRENGFFDAQILDIQTERNLPGDLTTIHVSVDEGEPYTVSNITFSGNTVFNGEKLSKKVDLKLNKNFDTSLIKKGETRIISSYQKEGYPYVQVSVETNRDPANHTVAVFFEITEGPRAFIRSIGIEGNFKTDKKTILKSVKFKEGDIYTYEKIIDAQLRLKRLGIFDYVLLTPHGIETEESQIDVLVKLVERKDITLDIQAGFDSDKLASGQVILTKRNLFGNAKHLQLRGVGGFEFDRGELTYYSPQIVGASWNLVNQYFGQYEDEENFNATSYGGSVGVLKNFGPDWTLLLKTQVTRFNIFEDESNRTALEDNLFDSTFSEIVASAAYDKRDNFADPRAGYYALLTTEFDTDLADISNNFNITRLNISHYLGFLKNFTLVNNVRIGKLFELSTNPRIPANKLFFMGGNDTVRGFDEDAINSSGGTTSIIYNAELHYRIFGDVKLAGFFDAGSLTDGFDNISRESFRESAGFGLRYVTPVGPIRLDYGFVLDKKEDEKGQRFHFSFGYFF